MKPRAPSEIYEWHDVRVKPPRRNGSEVLCLTLGKRRVAKVKLFEGKCIFMYPDSIVNQYIGVSHWCELPKPPNRDKRGNFPLPTSI